MTQHLTLHGWLTYCESGIDGFRAAPPAPRIAAREDLRKNETAWKALHPLASVWPAPLDHGVRLKVSAGELLPPPLHFALCEWDGETETREPGLKELRRDDLTHLKLLVA